MKHKEIEKTFENQSLTFKIDYDKSIFLYTWKSKSEYLDVNRFLMENLQAFYQGKTVLVITHRLSTMKQSDKIWVLEKGLQFTQAFY